MKTTYEHLIGDLSKAKESLEGWSINKVDEKCFIAVRSQGTILELRCHGTIQTNVKNIVIMAYLIKLYNECLPFCKESYDIKDASPFEKIAFLRFKIPLINDRCIYLRGIGIDRLEHNNTVCIHAEGIT